MSRANHSAVTQIKAKHSIVVTRAKHSSVSKGLVLATALKNVGFGKENDYAPGLGFEATVKGQHEAPVAKEVYHSLAQELFRADLKVYTEALEEFAVFQKSFDAPAPTANSSDQLQLIDRQGMYNNALDLWNRRQTHICDLVARDFTNPSCSRELRLLQDFLKVTFIKQILQAKKDAKTGQVQKELPSSISFSFERPVEGSKVCLTLKEAFDSLVKRGLEKSGKSKNDSNFNLGKALSKQKLLNHVEEIARQSATKGWCATNAKAPVNNPLAMGKVEFVVDSAVLEKLNSLWNKHPDWLRVFSGSVLSEEEQRSPVFKATHEFYSRVIPSFCVDHLQSCVKRKTAVMTVEHNSPRFQPNHLPPPSAPPSDEGAEPDEKSSLSHGVPTTSSRPLSGGDWSVLSTFDQEF